MLTAVGGLACAIGAVASGPLRPGDLLFVVEGSRVSAMSQAITAATQRQLPVTHVAMAVDDSTVVEAAPRLGVCRRALTAFMADVAADSASVLAMRCDSLDAVASVERALSLTGRPYDWAFAPGDSALYCSELIQLSCVDLDGRPVFHTEPMNFLGPDGAVPAYWQTLFDRLGLPVPQGRPGTNPAALAANPRLRPLP